MSVGLVAATGPDPDPMDRHVKEAAELLSAGTRAELLQVYRDEDEILSRRADKAAEVVAYLEAVGQRKDGEA